MERLKGIREQLIKDPTFWDCVRINGSVATHEAFDRASLALREKGLEGANEELSTALTSAFEMVDLLRELREIYELSIVELNTIVQEQTDLSIETMKEILDVK